MTTNLIYWDADGPMGPHHGIFYDLRTLDGAERRIRKMFPDADRWEVSFKSLGYEVAASQRVTVREILNSPEYSDRAKGLLGR